MARRGRTWPDAAEPWSVVSPKKMKAQTLLRETGPSYGAGDETRTRDINLGKVALYQLSYSRLLSGRGNYFITSG